MGKRKGSEKIEYQAVNKAVCSAPYVFLRGNLDSTVFECKTKRSICEAIVRLKDSCVVCLLELSAVL